MSTASPALKQRGAKKRGTTPIPESIQNGDVDTFLETAQKQVQESVKSDWEFKVALAVITVLAVITRFYGLSHPDQVVFDEVHFGKVCADPSATSIILGA